MTGLSSFRPKGKKTALWIGSSLIGLALLGLVIAQVDWGQVKVMLAGLSWSLLALGVLFLIAEAVFGALRLWLFADRKPCISTALKANAWYLMLLVTLPARLGEVGAVVILQRYFGQRYGAAAMSIITQRLYDVILLGALFLVALIGLGGIIETHVMDLAAMAMIAAAMILLTQMEFFLTLGAKILQKSDLGLMKKILRLVLQARIYTRHNFKKRHIPWAVLLTLGKWLSNLAALILLLCALHLDLSFFAQATVGAAYNFLAVIPLQTVGGIGVGEAGLMLLLAAMGIGTSLAAGASLMIRFVILLFPFLFWGLVMSGARMKEALIK